MKVEFLKDLGLDEEQIKKIQAESGKDVTAAKATAQTQIDSLTAQITELQGQVSQRDKDLGDVKTRLEQAGQSATKLGEVQQSLTDLQRRYNADTEAYKTKLADQEDEFKVRTKADKIDFSCNAAKNEFISVLMKDRLPVKDDSLIGFDDFLASQKEKDPGAFKAVEDPGKNPKPTFAPPSTKQEKPEKGSEFGMKFIGVRKHD